MFAKIGMYVCQLANIEIMVTGYKYWKNSHFRCLPIINMGPIVGKHAKKRFKSNMLRMANIPSGSMTKQVWCIHTTHWGWVGGIHLHIAREGNTVFQSRRSNKWNRQLCGEIIMHEIHTTCFAGDITIYQILPAPPGWYARYLGDSKPGPIAAFGLIKGPEDLPTRLVGLLGNSETIEPVDCLDDYLTTVYRPSLEEFFPQ